MRPIRKNAEHFFGRKKNVAEQNHTKGVPAPNAYFLAVRLLDGKIEPYKAFNGDNILIFTLFIGQYDGNITSLDFQFDKKPYWIRIMYNVHEDPKNYSQWILDHPSFERFREPLIYDYLEFTFNGAEFLKGYKKFKKIKGIY